MNTDRVKLSDDYRDWKKYFKESTIKEYLYYLSPCGQKGRLYSNIYLVMISGHYEEYTI